MFYVLPMSSAFPDSVLAASQDGTVIVHTIRRGQFLRTLRPPGESYVPAPISELQVGMEGHIVVQTSQEERPHRKVLQDVLRRRMFKFCFCL